MRKGSFFCLTFCIHQVADRTALHKDDWVMAVFTHRSGRQSVNILCFDRFEHAFKGEGRNMMALIHNDRSVLRYKGFDRLFFSLKQRLHNGSIADPAAGILSAANLTNQVAFFLPAA